LGALFVDALIIAAGLQLLGIPAYTASGGRVQSNILRYALCYGSSTVPPGVTIQPEFGPYYIHDCVDSWFGFPTGRWIVVSNQPGPQAGASTEVMVPIDANGRPLGSFSLDLQWLLIPVLTAYRIGFERRSGQTIGKRLTRVRVVQIDPGTGRFSPAAKRNLAFFLPILFPGWAPIGVSPWFRVIAAGIFCGVIVWQIATRRDAYYDKAAGTAVIRLGPHSTPVTVPASAV